MKDGDLQSVVVDGSYAMGEDELRAAHHPRLVRAEGHHVPRRARPHPIQRYKKP